MKEIMVQQTKVIVVGSGCRQITPVVVSQPMTSLPPPTTPQPVLGEVEAELEEVINIETITNVTDIDKAKGSVIKQRVNKGKNKRDSKRESKGKAGAGGGAGRVGWTSGPPRKHMTCATSSNSNSLVEFSSEDSDFSPVEPLRKKRMSETDYIKRKKAHTPASSRFSSGNSEKVLEAITYALEEHAPTAFVVKQESLNKAKQFLKREIAGQDTTDLSDGTKWVLAGGTKKSTGADSLIY